MDQYWIIYKPEELESEIEKCPITKESLVGLCSNNIIKVKIFYFENPESKGLTMYGGCEEGIPRYYIYINKSRPYKEKIKTFAHEIAHVHYHCGGTSFDKKNGSIVERIIEREAMNAIKTYPALFKSAFRKIAQGLI